MADRVCLVTGGNSGIGFELCRGMAAAGFHVVMVSRGKERGQPALEKLQAEFGDSVEMMLCDMSDLDNIQRLHAEYTAKFDRLDILFNNAGAMWGKRQITAQGHEMTFGVNHLGYFEMTRHFLPLLKATQGSRIINTASVAHRMAHLRLDNLNHENKWYSQWRTYGNSKLCNILFTRELARRLEGRNHHPLLPSRCGSNSIWFRCKWHCVAILAHLPYIDDQCKAGGKNGFALGSQ